MVGFAALVLAGIAAVASNPASAKNEPTELTATQQQFLKAYALAGRLNQHPPTGWGFTMATPSSDGSTITAWTKSGSVPAAFVAESGRAGVAVLPRRATLSLDEIRAVEAKILKARAAGVRLGSSRILGVAVDFVGQVQVLVDEVTPWAASTANALFGRGSARLTAFTPPAPDAGRLADAAPFKGGARVKMAGSTSVCTTGFGAKSQTNGSYYVLTAEHCVNDADPRFWTWSNAYMGTVTAQNPQWDVAAIKTDPRTTTGKFYRGAYNSAYVASLQQVVAPTPMINKRICVEGSYSGEQCNGAYITGYMHLTYAGETQDRVLWYTNGGPTGTVIGGSGDSGASVIIYPPDVANLYAGVGIYTAHWGSTSCAVAVGGDPNRPTAARCGPNAYFSDLSSDVAAWNLSLYGFS